MGDRGRFRRLVGLVGLALGFVVVGCSGRDAPPDVDAGVDAGSTDAEVDAGGVDAGVDDAGVDAGPVDAGPLTGESYFYVLDRLDVGAPDPDGDSTIVPGFDLDGQDNRTMLDPSSCRVRDHTSPPPDDEGGVDNALGPILGANEERFGLRRNLELSVQAGTLLVLAQVRGVDDFVNDDRVELDILFGVLPEGAFAPQLEASGRFVPGQTFDVDARSLEPMVTLPGRIVNGRLDAGPGTLSLTVPFGPEVITLGLDRVRIRFDITESALSRGVVGGALNVDETVEELAGIEGIDEGAVRAFLPLVADLDRDAAAGRCTSVSIALVFDGASAIQGDVVTP